MKKNYLLTIIAIAFALVLASCGTSVKIDTMVPSKVDLTGYSSIKIEEPTVRGIFFAHDKDRIQSKTRDMFAKALSKGSYTVVLSGKADAVMTSDIIVDSSRSFVAVEKTTETDDEGKVIYKYYLKQTAMLSFSYYLRDFRTGAVLDSYSTRVGMPSLGYEVTYLGNSTDPDDPDFRYRAVGISDYIGGYEEAIDSIESTVVNRLVPHTKTVSVSLMDNKPEVEGLKGAYDAVNDGLYREALIVFDKVWQKSGYVQAGYNSAVLMYATGDRERAIARAYEVWEETGSEKALTLYSKLQGMKADDKLAKKQSGLR